MKPVTNAGTTPSPANLRGADPGLPAPPPGGGGGLARQRLGTAEATGVLAQPRPAAPGGARATAEPLPQASDHSTATVQRSNARTRTQSFDSVVQVRYFDTSMPPRSRSGEGEMPLRNAPHLESPRRARRPPPEPPAPPPQPAAAAPLLPSRWGDGGETQQRSSSRTDAPHAPMRRPDRGDDDKSA